ncbi:MAG: hypothetical protein M3680_18170 [Myxococcota bacterium]|nr:hypothetical protein [Myxococcota bacterium]
MGVGYEEPQQVPQQAPVTVHADGGGATARAPSTQEAREAAWKELEAFAKEGKGRASDVPRLVRVVAHDEGVKTLLPELAKRVPGNLVLELAEDVGFELVATLALAVDATAPPSKAVLLRYLHQRGNLELADLGADAGLVTKLRGLLPGPMGMALPQLANLSSIQDKLPLVKWYLETTAPGIAAIQLASEARSKALAATLDALDEWVWLDHLPIAANTAIGAELAELAKNTTNDVAKVKLAALQATYTRDANARNDELRAAVTALPKQVENKNDTALLDTAARTQQMETKVDSKKLLARLRGESAEMVLQYLFVTDHPAEVGIEALAQATGDRAQHLREYLRMKGSVEVAELLAKDGARKQVRKLLGRSTTLFELLDGSTLDRVHASVAGDEALRRWIYEDPDERATLWLAAASAQNAKQNCRLVASEHGNGWVKRLPASADEHQLRRFVLNSKDAKAVKLVKDTLLRDAPHTVDAEQSEVEAIDSATYGVGSKARLTIESSPASADVETVLARLADLTPQERAEVLGEPAAITRLLDDVYGASLVRAMFLLRPTLPQLLAMRFTSPEPALLGYVATRPDHEEVTTVGSAKLIGAARKLFGFNSPIDVFPSLQRPANLAKALANNHVLLEWMLEETEPSYALSLLARDPVRPVATTLMEERATIYADFPAYDLLLPEGQRGFDALAKGVTDDDSREQVTAYKEGEADIEMATNRTAETLADAADLGDLAKAVLELVATRDKAGMLALVRRAGPAQQLTLLDGKHRDATSALRSVTRLMPQQIFPALSIAQLFALDGAAHWMLTWETPTVLLSLLGRDAAALKSLGKRLDAEPDQLTWIESLPRGAALMPAERQVLDQLCRHVTTATVVRALFRVRFDVEVQGFDAPETKRLWRVVERLPPAQLNQNSVEKIVEKEIGPLGQWSKPDIELDDDSTRYQADDHGYDEKQQLTLAQVKQQYGLTDAEVRIAADPKTGWLVEQGGRYTVKPIAMDQFAATVLHEIGHSVDTMLGEHTELAYGLAGWKRYGVDQFETWAEEMNGFDKLSAADKPKVTEAWKHALHGNTGVKELVSADHPALDAKYQGNPLVDAARAGNRFHFTEANKQARRGRVSVTREALLFSLSEEGYQAAPSQYALHAPEEYFAECYVEFYRQYDGTPKTEAAKGGRLAAWIKDWFAKHVDKIRLNPARVRKPAGEP